MGLVLAFTIAQPMESHIHSFCAFRLDFSIDNCFSCQIVDLEQGARLFVPQFSEDDTNGDSLPGHDV